MNRYELMNMKKKELEIIASDIKARKFSKKSDMVDSILDARNERYKICDQLGEPGKDAITYCVLLKNKKYAKKQFKPRKSVKKIEEEAQLQIKASKVGISPKIIEINDRHKYIVMDKLDKHLIDVNGLKKISLDHQKQLIKIYNKLDEQGIFHGDANPLNYMIKNKKLYVIDFGMSKKITPQLQKKLNTNTPNLTIMTTGMVIKLKLMNYPVSSYSYLLKYLPDELKSQLVK